MKSKDFDVVKQARAVVHEQFKHYRERMAAKLSKEEPLSQKYAREQLKKQMQPFYDLYEIEDHMPKDTKKKLYLVDTVVTFRHTYVIEADELEHAYDEVTMRDSGNPADEFTEVSQRYLGETISNGRQITKKEFKQMLIDLEKDTKENSSYWLGKDLIRKINYNR